MEFSIQGRGRIWLIPLSTGEMAVFQSGRGRVVDVFAELCRPEVSSWLHSSRTFVIHAEHVNDAIERLQKESDKLV